MKKVIFTLMGALSLGFTAQAQWMADSVLMGAGSVNDVFYSLQNGTVKTENNKNWHLAFSMSPSDSASIWANHNAGNNFVKVYNIHKGSADWSTVSLADTAAAMLCYNNDKGWYQGALNALPRSSVFSFGWGTYDMVSHNVFGDSLFIIKANNVFYKVAIDSLQSMQMNYFIRVENLTTPGATVVDTIMKGTAYTSSIFAYYNLATGTDSVREPASNTWDLVFNRYNSFVDQGSGPIPYSVVGGLSNKGIKVAKANGVHVDTAFVHYGNYVMPWPIDSTMISAVGYDWKSFTPPGPWIVPDSISYFINDKSGSLYQLQFTGYNGSGAGIIYLRKRMVVPVAVTDVNASISTYEFFPNPAQNEINITLESKQASEAKVSLTSISGQQVFANTIQLHSGINAYTLPVNTIPTGNYILSLNGTQIRINEIITIKH